MRAKRQEMYRQLSVKLSAPSPWNWKKGKKRHKEYYVKKNLHCLSKVIRFKHIPVTLIKRFILFLIYLNYCIDVHIGILTKYLKQNVDLSQLLTIQFLPIIQSMV